jgi:hypothetical protein
VHSTKFEDFVNLLDTIHATKEHDYLQHIDDPYALMLLFGIMGPLVKLPRGIAGSDTVSNEFTCKDVWEFLHDPDTDWLPVLMALSKNGRHYLDSIAQGGHPEGISARDVIREFSKIRSFDADDTYRAWLLQPHSEAMAFAMLSEYTKKAKDNVSVQRITPAAGFPIRLMEVNGRIDQIRYPALAMCMPEGVRAQLHKSGPDVRVFGPHNELLDVKPILYDNLPHDGVFDGFVVWDKDHSIDFFHAWDVVQLNDVWLYGNSLSQRHPLLWRIAPHVVDNLVVWNEGELKSFMGVVEEPVVVKNLNSEYDPYLRGAWIDYSIGFTAQLRVSRVRRGDKISWTLRTRDNVDVFHFGGQNVGVKNQDRIVEVDKSGRIIRHRPDLGFGHDWDEVAKIFDVEKPEDLNLEDDGWLKRTLWKKLVMGD